MTSEEDMVSLPPLLTAHPVTASVDPFDKAVAMATLGCEAGTVTYHVKDAFLRAAIVFAPEVPLAQAMAMVCVCGVGYSNALGALAPPEVAVHMDWMGRIWVNGARCGHLKVAASDPSPQVEPAWLIVGLEVPFFPPSSRSPGKTPDQTTLFEEGCVEVVPLRLLESWARHTLVWINRWTDDGPEPLHAEWRTMLKDLGEKVSIDLAGRHFQGNFLGIDENFGMLIRDGEQTDLIPMTDLLKKEAMQ